MKTINPKEFISSVLIDEVEDIHLQHPYIAFATMAIGIEFLGKCLNLFQDWNMQGRSKADFELAINSLSSLSSYRPYLSSYKLWDSLRNGFLHSFVPKETLTLSSKAEMSHLIEHDGRLNLKCEDFFIDFKAACNEIIHKEFVPTDKMNLPLLSVPNNAISTSEKPTESANSSTTITPSGSMSSSGTTYNSGLTPTI